MSNLFEGYREGGQDWNVREWTSTTDMTPTGIGGTGTIILQQEGVNIVNITGTVTAAVPSGLGASTPQIKIQNGTPNAITVEGVYSGTTFNGNLSYSISTGTTATFYNYGANAGETWVTL